MDALAKTFPYSHALFNYVRRVRRAFNPRSVILYGSIARENYGVGSDLDVLVISNKLPKNFLRRLMMLSELNNSFAPIEAVGYTIDEFERMLKKLHPTALSALEDGHVIYDDGFFASVREEFYRMKAKLRLRRVKNGWEVESTISMQSERS